jgi:hypothetical protein
MAVSFTNYGKRIVFCILIFACICSPDLYSQKKLSGRLKLPRSHVVSIGIDKVIIDDASFFTGDTIFMPGDTILLIQMQGIEIRTPSDDSYGDLQDKVGEPGMHEFMIIQSINTVTKEIVFANNISKSFNVEGNLQIIRVPYFNSAEVTGKLYCDPWDPVKKSGGVLPLIIGRELKLSADIDVSGSGFRGAGATVGDGIAVNTDPSVYGLSFYNSSFLNAGLKGEGLGNLDETGVLLSTYATKGYGPNYNGGGGGNGKYSGGGGGSHRGKGGKGGRESFFPPHLGGNGGYKTEHIWLPGPGIYLGGGGGGSTGVAGNLTGKGGNGGGIVIIIADLITGNGGKIIANGAKGGSSAGQAGSGGGGAGGSVALSVKNYGSNNLIFSVTGGKGGDNAGDFGEGGGGSGGLVYVSMDTPGNVNNILDGGSAGSSVNPSAGSGEPGEKKTGFEPELNGFLFNSIRSSITNDQVDSICAGTKPPKLTGTNPIGGVTPYTYVWQKTYDPTFSEISWTTVMSNNDSVNYTPTATETTTVFFRRMIIDASSPLPLKDRSKPIKIIVNPVISNNTVSIPHDIICFGGNPESLIPSGALSGGSGKYVYKWQVSTDDISFSDPVNISNTESYTPLAGLKITSYYKRIVSSGRCVDNSPRIKVTVLDSIKNNLILSLPEDICYGTGFKKLLGTSPDTVPTLSGGNNVYTYSWESSVNNGAWTNAPGVSNASWYRPVETGDPEAKNNYRFRRIVLTGPSNSCIGTSNIVTLRDYPVLRNNTISSDQIICPGTIPQKITGSIPSGGDGVYSYTWQDSSSLHTWTNIPDAVSCDYQPGALNTPVKFRRIVLSGPGSCCNSYSDAVLVDLHGLPAGNIVNEADTLCNYSNSVLNIQLTGNGPWNVAFKDVLSGKDSTVNMLSGGEVTVKPRASAAMTRFQYELIRVEDRNGCLATVLTGNKNVFVYKIPEPDAGADQTVCGPVVKLAAIPGIGAGRWIFPQSVISSAPADPESLTTIDSSFTGARITHRFYWEEQNWKCSRRDSVDITFDRRIAMINAGPDTAFYSIDNILHLSNEPVQSWEKGVWSIVTGSGNFEDNGGDNYPDLISGLSTGRNIFRWEVSNGTCFNSDEFTVDVHPLEIPEGFSPNNDPEGYNNTFVIKGMDLDNYIADIHYFNNKGAEVFETTNASGQVWSDWDGKNSKGVDVPEGTYFYQLKIVSKQNGSVFRKNGFVILKRY